MHARDRYRLRPLRENTPNQPMPDPSLWIVHYHRSEPVNQMPANSIPLTEYTHNLMRERNALQSSGRLQLKGKNFMLHDRSNWPSIQLPGTSAHTYVQQSTGYPNNVMAQMNRGQPAGYVQNAQAAMTQRGAGPPPSKRPRNASVGNPNESIAAMPLGSRRGQIVDFDDDKEVNADCMDFLTPQDISTVRYKQHHEWLEEILNSAYDTHRIIPGELGLGRKGELESLTEGFFSAHTQSRPDGELALPSTPKKEHYDAGLKVVEDAPIPTVGRLSAGKADAFRKIAAQRMDDVRAEMEELRIKHATAMERLKSGKRWMEADQALKIPTSTSINGQEAESQITRIEQVIAGIESTLQRRIRPVKAVECIDKGGLEDKAPSSANGQAAESPADALQETENKPSDSSETESSSSEPGSSADTKDAASKEVIASDRPNPSGSQTSAASPEALVADSDDWVVVNRNESATTSDHGGDNQTPFDNPSKDTTAPLNEDLAAFAAMPDATAAEDDAPDYQGTEFEAGLEFADIQMTEPDLTNYAQGMESLEAADPGSVDATQGVESAGLAEGGSPALRDGGDTAP